MATLKLRYGGNIVSLPEGFTFNPQNFGTARLNYKINSSSTGKLGLTTKTAAKEYCKLQMRIGGQICYIGRVSSTSYISGDTVDYHDSSTGLRSQSVSSSSEVLQSAATKPIEYYSSSMSTSTYQFTSVTSTERVETRSYTQEVWSRSDTGTSGSGSGNGTSAAQPSLRTLTNSTGSTVTTRTVENKVLTNSSFRETETNSQTYHYSDTYSGRPINDKNTLTTSAKTLLTSDIFIANTMSQWNTHYSKYSSYMQSPTTDYRSVNASVYSNFSRQVNSATGSNTTYTPSGSRTTQKTTKATTYTYQIATATQADTPFRSATWAYYAKVSYGANIKSETFGSYSTNWLYYWTSCKKVTYNYYSTRTVREYSTRSYTGTTYYSSITRSTTFVSETIHNINV